METRVVDDHDIQLKTSLELAKMCGYYAADESNGEKDRTGETSQFDFRAATEDEVDAILKILSDIRKEILWAKAKYYKPKPK